MPEEPCSSGLNYSVLLLIIAVMVSFACFGCSSNKEGGEITAVEKEFSAIPEKSYIPNLEKKVLIVYYSYTETTEDIAERLQKKTGGDLFEIDGYWSEVETEKTLYNISEESIKENKSDKSTLLENGLPDISSYDLILVGSLAWWENSLPTPVMGFLAEMNFGGKEVTPFCIDQGGVGGIFKDFERQAQNADILKGLYLKNVKPDHNKDYIEQQINTWLYTLNV